MRALPSLLPRPRVLASLIALCRGGYMGVASMDSQLWVGISDGRAEAWELVPREAIHAATIPVQR